METPTPDSHTQAVYDVLKYIIDPEIGVNIVDLGLVYGVTLTDQELTVEMTLTTPGCPMSNTITTATEQILQRKFPDHQIAVELVWEPAWTPERIVGRIGTIMKVRYLRARKQFEEPVL